MQIEKNKLNLKLAYKDKNLVSKIFDQITNVNHYGSDSEEEEDGKATKIKAKYNPINKKADLEGINYLVSEHTKCLQ